MYLYLANKTNSQNVFHTSSEYPVCTTIYLLKLTINLLTINLAIH